MWFLTPALQKCHINLLIVYIHIYTYIYIYIYIYLYIYIIYIYIYSKLEITPNTTPEYFENRLFIVDYGEQDLLVSAFDCLHQDNLKPRWKGVGFNDINNGVGNAWKTTA